MEKRVSNLLWALVGLVVAIAAISIILSFVFRGGPYVTYGPFSMMGYGYYGMGLIMPVIGAVSVIFVIIFVYFLVESGRESGRPYVMPANKTPEEIAKERLARGEITDKEYSSIMDQLKR